MFCQMYWEWTKMLHFKELNKFTQRIMYQVSDLPWHLYDYSDEWSDSRESFGECVSKSAEITDP